MTSARGHTATSDGRDAGDPGIATQASWRQAEPVHVLSRSAIGKLAGWLYLGGGLVGLAALALNGTYPAGVSRGLLVEVCAVAVVVGALAAWVLPWERWPREATLVLVLFGLGILGLANVVLGDWMPAFHSVFYIVIFGWLGIAQGRWAATRWAPVVAVAYVLPPFLDGTPLTGDARSGFILSALLAIPSGALLGELIAWVGDQLRVAEAADALRLAGMGALLEACTTLAYEVDEAASPDIVAKLAGELLAGDAALVFVLKNGRLTATGAWPHESPDLVLDLDGDAGAAVRPTLEGGDVAELHRGISPDTDFLLGTLGARTAVVLALRGAVEPIGIVVVTSSVDAGWLDAFREDLARAFALQAGLALERSWTRRSLRDASLLDELTGLGNRRSAAGLLARTQAGDVVGILDLDHFKEVNDTLGHAAGDDLLRDLGEYLGDAVRGDDDVARYGGEEFLIILRGAGPRARKTFERLLEGWRVRLPEATFSVGYAVHQAQRSPAATLRLADRALYAAKAAGRDRVCSVNELARGSSGRAVRRGKAADAV